jgi:hypothetical protein
MNSRHDILVLIDRDRDSRAVLDALRRVAQVTQILEPRLALVAGEVPVDVTGATAYVDDVPDAVLDTLSPVERLFVSAWRSRRSGKSRPSEGLPWDAPGHLPPDPPPGHPSPEARPG